MSCEIFRYDLDWGSSNLLNYDDDIVRMSDYIIQRAVKWHVGMF